MIVKEILDKLPNAKGAVIVLSGGMDSTCSMRFAIEKYGNENIKALSFYYGQKQSIELEKAKESCSLLKVKHKILDLSILGEISKGFSANIDKNISMPTIQDVLGDPRPKTYVPNRNMILMSLCASFAEVNNFNVVIMGLQQNDLYNYHDTTPRFIEKINNVLSENRIIQIKIITPFINLTKKDEIKAILDLDGNINLFKHTLTCYKPNDLGESCRECPSCAERLKAFKDINIEDPIKYVLNHS